MIAFLQFLNLVFTIGIFDSVIYFVISPTVTTQILRHLGSIQPTFSQANSCKPTFYTFDKNQLHLDMLKRKLD